MSSANPKFTKHDVIATHKAHPDWTCCRIAGHLGCMVEYVSATMRRNGLKLPNSGQPRYTARLKPSKKIVKVLEDLREHIETAPVLLESAIIVRLDAALAIARAAA